MGSRWRIECKFASGRRELTSYGCSSKQEALKTMRKLTQAVPGLVLEAILYETPLDRYGREMREKVSQRWSAGRPFDDEIPFGKEQGT